MIINVNVLFVGEEHLNIKSLSLAPSYSLYFGVLSVLRARYMHENVPGLCLVLLCPTNSF